MPIKLEQFIYGSFNKVGYRQVTSPNTHKIIGEDSFKYLRELKGEGVIQTLLPENVVAVSFLRSDSDDFGRKTVWNHTILIPIEDYFTLNPSTMFTSHFKEVAKTKPNQLNTYKVQ